MPGGAYSYDMCLNFRLVFVTRIFDKWLFLTTAPRRLRSAPRFGAVRASIRVVAGAERALPGKIQTTVKCLTDYVTRKCQE